MTLVETGDDSQTGGRLKRVESYIQSDTFMFTYGDGVSDVNLNKLLIRTKNQDAKQHSQQFSRLEDTVR